MRVSVATKFILSLTDPLLVTKVSFFFHWQESLTTKWRPNIFVTKGS